MAEQKTLRFSLPSAGDPILADIVRRLVDVYHPERIYLFGSVARGAADPDSDYDLMIIVPDDAPLGLRDCTPGYKAMKGLGRSGDFLVWTREAFEKRLHLQASLPSTIIREGKLLYAE